MRTSPYLCKTILLLSPAAMIITGCAASEQNPTPPNIILILSDDMGYSDLGCFGSEIETPNLDRLGQEGVIMTRFYNAARCCPTRASLLTGQYQHQAGVGMMVSDWHIPAYRGFLNDSSATIAEVLRENGYQTFMSGKWHVGDKEGHWPTDRGFDRYFGLIGGANSYYSDAHFRDTSQTMLYQLDGETYDILPTTEEMWKRNEGFYFTDAVTEHAINFIHEADSAKPFFLYLAYTAPHWPLHAFPEDIERFSGVYDAGWDSLRNERFRRQKTMGIVPPDAVLAPLDDKVSSWDDASPEEKEEFIQEMEIYAAMIYRMDANIGKLLADLEGSGKLGNTVIMFLSDNGGCHTTPEFSWFTGTPGGPNSFPCYGYMGAELSNTPFRKYKQYIHEGGISSPFIAWNPSYVKDGRTDDQMAHITDIMPTILDLCGGFYPDSLNDKELQPMRGISLVPAFRGNILKREKPVFFEHMGNRGIREGKWKLVASRPDFEWELYNMEEDRTEQHNLIDKKPELAEELKAKYEAWAEDNAILSPDEFRERMRR